MNKFNFFETINLENSKILNLNEHLFRIRKTFLYIKSITGFNKFIDEDDIVNLIKVNTKNFNTLRVKINFKFSKNTLSIEITKSKKQKPKNLFKLHLINKPIIDSKNMDHNFKFNYLQKIYQNLLFENQKVNNDIDDIIFINEKKEVCETSKANMYILDNVKKEIITPALNSGVLAGTYRSSLLKNSKVQINNKEYTIKEDTINIKDLYKFKLLISNAIIKLRRAIII